LSKKILESLKEKIQGFESKPILSIILCGEDKDSVLYTNIKKKRGEEIGMQVDIHKVSSDVTQEKLIETIKELNKTSTGLIVQLPLPSEINANEIVEAIDPDKDVDGLTPLNFGKTLTEKEELASATPKGIIKLLEEYNIEIKGKEVTIVNNSNIIGKPLAIMMANRGATVTICHSKTKDLAKNTKNADILITGVGKPGLITGDMIKEDAVVIDAGIAENDGKWKGDVTFDEVKEKVSYITPVPGGVGPMTVAMLLENVVIAYELQRNKNE